MKITRIQTSNFLGARAVDLDLKKPVALFAGKNGAGKSSVRDAIALAFTADLCRVHLKKEAATLISEGGESCFVEITTDADTYGVAITAAGKISDTMAGKETPAALPYVLDAQRFAKLDENGRRQFLFGLMGVKMDGAAVKDRLIARGCDAGKAEQVMPILRTGFDAASKEAATRAREAKASWKTATGGETWGKDKAAKWQPAPLPDDADKARIRHDNATKKTQEIEAELATAQQELGAAKAEQKRQHEAEARRFELHEQAGKVDRIKTKLARDEADVIEWQAKVETTREKAGVVPVNPKDLGEFLLRGLAAVTDDFLTLSSDYHEVDWPSELINRASAHLAEYKKLHGWPHSSKGQTDPEAAARLPEYENALALLQRSVANDKRDLVASEQAAATLKELDGLKANTDPSAAEAKVSELTEKRSAWLADAEKYRDIADKFARRETLIKQAAQLHADVMSWTDIADALAPDGIPAEMLVEALGPINERLFASCVEADWAQVVIHPDMRITYGPREYALLSESEKWRADAMIAEAVSHISGLKMLVLDRFDVLDMKGREDLLYWLDGMAQDGYIDTALIFGTLKGLPAQLLPSIEAFWIENGAAGQMKEEA